MDQREEAQARVTESSTMRVAMIIQAYYPHIGGAERQLAALIPLLQRRGVDVHILTRRYPGMLPFERVNGVPVHRAPIPGPKALAAASFTAYTLWQVARLKPDLIHAHELLSPTTAAIAAKRLMRTPILAKVLRGGELGDVAKLKSRPGGQRRIEWIRKNVDAFAVISNEIDGELEGIGVQPERRVFVPNGVDTDRYAPPAPVEKRRVRFDLDIPVGSIVAVYTGRLVPEKKIEHIIQIWPDVRRDTPGAELLILGGGPERERLEAAAGEGVRLVGEVEDVLPYLKAADLFILPSSTEGMSNSLLEATAVGLGCIATKVGGAADLIEHGKSGWLISPNEIGQLKDAVASLIRDAELRASLGEEARKSTAQRYSLDRSAQRLYSLYRELLSVELRGGKGSYSRYTA